ncbi:TPA: hypothetical protein ACNHAC_004482 [Enterobacter kobei]
MSAITKEFTKEQLQQIIETDHVQCGEASALARIALASLEAEAVCVIDQSNLDYLKSGSDADVWPASRAEMGDVLLYRAAPPAPVSDEDLLHMAASAIDDLLSNKDRSGAGVWADIPAKLRRAAMLQGADGNSPVIPDCSCHACRPVTFADSRFVVCPVCGNKRCPHANDHRNACTGSNEPGQEGSAYPAAPQQEAKP